jgi:hypothetical protein
MQLLICLLTNLKENIIHSYLQLFTLNIKWQVITILFSHSEHKPHFEFRDSSGNDLVSVKYIPGLLKHNKPQPILAFLCLVR